MADEFRPTICVDFDGVVHSYEKGWQGGEIYGMVIPGFFEWAERAAAAGLSVVIYSSRSKTAEGRAAMKRWLLVHWSHIANEADMNVDWVLLFPPSGARPFQISFAHEKPPAWLTIDDRAIRFEGQWDDPLLTPEAIRAFKPWNAVS